MRTVVAVPRSDHLPLPAARFSLLCDKLEVFTTPTRRYHNRTLIRPSPLRVSPPRVRRHLDPMPWPSPFIRCLPIRQDILNISKIAVTFYGIRSPFFIQTWVQQYSRCPFCNSAYCSVNNPICFWTVRGRRKMIPGKIFTRFPKFQGIVSVNDFWFPSRLQALLQAPFSFLRSFCSTRIRLNPLSCQVLHHNCISVIVSRFISFGEDFVICCYQVAKIFCTKYDFTSTASALPDLIIFVFPEMRVNTVLFARYHSSLRLQRWFARRTRVSVSVSRDSFIYKIPRELLQPFWFFGMWRVSPYLFMVLIFIWFWGFGWFIQQLFWCFRRIQVSPFFPFDTFTWHSCGIGMYPARVSPFLSSHSFACHSWRLHGWWSRRAWGRRGMINFLPWRCHGCWRKQAWGRTRW